MKYSIGKSFIRDAKKAPLSIQSALKDIFEKIEEANQIADISKIKKCPVVTPTGEENQQNAILSLIKDHK